MGVTANVIEKSGAWLSYGGDRIGQGRENAKAFLRDHPEISARLEAEILTKSGIVRPGVGPVISSPAAPAPLAAANSDIEGEDDGRPRRGRSKAGG
jgi:recombination protein RecA